jgi:chitin synthase
MCRRSFIWFYIVESANDWLAPLSEDSSLIHMQILLLEQAGFQTRGPTGAASIAFAGSTPFISAYGQNGFDEFCINFADELLHF